MSGSVGQLTQFSPGVGVFSSQWANGLTQTGPYVSNLRSFTGINNSTVYLTGYTSQGDGGQGMFCWNSTVTGTDDGGVTTVVPNGVVMGAWLRQFPGGVVRGPASSISGDIALFNGTTGQLLEDSGVTLASIQGSIGAVTTIAALRATTTATLTSPNVFVEGYSTDADGGEGIFIYVSTDTTSADNGGTIIVDASARRWHREASAAVLNLHWFGGNASGGDNAPALAAALAALPAGGGRITSTRGTYTFLSAVNFSYPTGTFSLTIDGAGADVTIFQWGNGNGIGLTLNSPYHTIHMRDLTISTTSAGTGTGVSVLQGVQGGSFGQNDFTRVTFRGSDGGGASNYWVTGSNTIGLCNVNYIGCLWYGNSTAANCNGAVVSGNVAGSFKYSIVHNFIGCGWFNLGIGFTYGTYVQGVTFSQSNWTNGTTSIYLQPGAVSAAQLTVMGCQLAGSGNMVVTSAPIAGLIFVANLVYVAINTAGLDLAGGGDQSTFHGNIFSGLAATGNTGILFGGDWVGCNVTGNSFFVLAVGTNLSGSPSGNNVNGNSYQGVTTNVANPGSNSVGVATQ